MSNLLKQQLRIKNKNIIENNISKIKAISTQSYFIKQIINLIDEFKIHDVGLYYPNQYEIDITNLLYLKKNISFSLPKIIDKKMYYCLYRLGDPLIKNKLNIYETVKTITSTPKLICIPGLGFKKDGFRLGYGKGFFDRYISINKSEIVTIGICIKEQIINEFFSEPWDQKVNYILTI